MQLCLTPATQPAVDVELPQWWSRKQRLKNTFFFHLIRAGIALARVIPLQLLIAFGQTLGFIGFLLPLRERKRAVQQLRMAGFTNPWTITRRMFVHMGRLGAEWVKLDRVIPQVSFPDESKQVLRDALAEGRGVLAVTPHFGNWELLAQASAFHGFRCTTIAKPTFDPRVTALLSDFRESAGVTTLWRGQGPLTERLTAVLQRREVLGVLIDQDTKVASTFVPFFGRLASTPMVPASLAIKQGSAVVYGHCVRNGGRYVIHYERVPLLDTAEALTADLTARTERAIREHPEQWVWLHARWKRQPT